MGNVDHAEGGQDMTKRSKVIQALAAALLITLIGSQTVGATGRTQEITPAAGDTNIEVPITVEIGSSFTVSLPVDIPLVESQETKGLFTHDTEVGVKGNLIEGAYVIIETEKSVPIYDITNQPTSLTGASIPAEDDQSSYQHKNPVSATITKNGFLWSREELLNAAKAEGSIITYDETTGYHNTAVAIRATGITSGRWRGVLPFTIKYIEGDPLGEFAPGLYTANNVRTKSWKELLDEKIVTVTGTVLSKIEYDVTGYLVVDDSITEIEASAGHFRDLTGIAFSKKSKLTKIGSLAFYESPLKKAILPEGLLIIEKSAFGGCESLTKINIPSTVTTIGETAFRDVPVAINVPSGVSSIGESAFLNVPRIYYYGTATGSPWGAEGIN